MMKKSVPHVTDDGLSIMTAHAMQSAINRIPNLHLDTIRSRIIAAPFLIGDETLGASRFAYDGATYVALRNKNDGMVITIMECPAELRFGARAYVVTETEILRVKIYDRFQRREKRNKRKGGSRLLSDA